MLVRHGHRVHGAQTELLQHAFARGVLEHSVRALQRVERHGVGAPVRRLGALDRSSGEDEQSTAEAREALDVNGFHRALERAQGDRRERVEAAVMRRRVRDHRAECRRVLAQHRARKGAVGRARQESPAQRDERPHLRRRRKVGGREGAPRERGPARRDAPGPVELSHRSPADRRSCRARGRACGPSSRGCSGALRAPWARAG